MNNEIMARIKLGATLQKLAKMNDLSQREVAHAINSSNSHVNKLYHGDAPRHVKDLVALSEFYRVSIDELVFGLDYRSKIDDTNIKNFRLKLEPDIKGWHFKISIQQVE